MDSCKDELLPFRSGYKLTREITERFNKEFRKCVFRNGSTADISVSVVTPYIEDISLALQVKLEISFDLCTLLIDFSIEKHRA